MTIYANVHINQKKFWVDSFIKNLSSKGSLEHFRTYFTEDKFGRIFFSFDVTLEFILCNLPLNCSISKDSIYLNSKSNDFP